MVGFYVWLVAGPVEHWRFGLKSGIWGVSEDLKRKWGEKDLQRIPTRT